MKFIYFSFSETCAVVKKVKYKRRGRFAINSNIYLYCKVGGGVGGADAFALFEKRVG